MSSRAIDLEFSIMWQGLIWGVTAGLILLWSACTWALSAVLEWAAGLAGAQAGGAAGTVGEAARQAAELKLPPWLETWMPSAALKDWSALIESLAPWIESLLGAMPAVAGWITPLIWVVWTLGTGALLLLALGASLLLRQKNRLRAPQAA
ncbi:hypothetical protein [Roseateles sp.]|uniref:hypothetical protein n=1 Tax=Roseateles sp. TaxID=1971397 RepID=UPI0037C81045